MIKSIDKATCRLLSTQIEAALQSLAQQNGVVIKRGRATYDVDGKNMTLKVEVAVVAADGTVANKEVENFKSMAELYDLKPEFLFKIFSYAGTTYKIAGLLPRRSKRPVLCERQPDGKRFILSPEEVKLGMRLEA